MAILKGGGKKMSKTKVSPKKAMPMPKMPKGKC